MVRNNCRRRSGKDSSWLLYKEAIKFVHQLNLKNGNEWKKYIHDELKHLPKKPNNIPATPWYVYANKGWKGIRDWLEIS